MRIEYLIGGGIALFLFCAILGLLSPPILFFLLIMSLVWILYSSKLASGSLNWTSTKPRKKEETVGSIPNTDFSDIGGQERAKQELREALDFLLYPQQMSAYGIRPLNGLLLTGPPGTGKTLMAKAAAHYTDSVFVHASGSEFVEMYVGIGAQRIRELFQKARRLAKKKQKTSAIVFIDEIDGIGGKREGSRQKEYDQTLNQLLTEMDGITKEKGMQILVMAATNRLDMLDEALLRPGRFDRHIQVDLPDKKARRSILELHTKNKPLHEDVNLDQIAMETFHFSGAQLESLTNEAAIYAMREKEQMIHQRHLSAAVDKVMMGERTDRETTQEEKERVAIHELGHAIVAEVTHPHSVSQVTLTPRGQALGYVRHYPQEDRYLYTKPQLHAQIQVCLAGAAAEKYMYGNQSTGAKNDYEQANRLAYTLIESGLSDLGIIHPQWISKEKMQKEASQILQELVRETDQLIAQYGSIFPHALQILLKEETLSGDRFRDLLKYEDNI